jgi:hypothetical protein
VIDDVDLDLQVQDVFLQILTCHVGQCLNSMESALPCRGNDIARGGSCQPPAREVDFCLVDEGEMLMREGFEAVCELGWRMVELVARQLQCHLGEEQGESFVADLLVDLQDVEQGRRFSERDFGTLEDICRRRSRREVHKAGGAAATVPSRPPW